ncbi:hypothetical protein CAPTEDRAFT_203032 [Capitella teleta]|uniref:Uncharacterized protein n=1 Tax=Capitella teleta TaxID=283909 RepID=R7TNM1_CAPTE|nr:hypothetical protein CAPTEDRAFT_203032 [Capitella teleta]|eukprot:ELT95142.1 hypothetical protein CAPTEDRAFT_203032 [Capitella teleta]
MEPWPGDVREVTLACLKTTSIKGVPRALKVESVLLKIVWCFFILGFFIAAVYLVHLQVVEYSKYPTIINFNEILASEDLIKKWKIFPSILFCNLKPVHIKDNASVYNLMDYLGDVTINMTRFRRQQEQVSPEVESAFEHLYKVQGYYDFLGTATASSYGQTAEQFVVSCTLTSKIGGIVVPCGEVADVDQLVSPTYINCYSITMTKESIMKFKPELISVILHLGDADDYIHTDFSHVSNDLQSSGVMMQLYTENIDLVRLGTRLEPGTLTTSHFLIGKRERLAAPYGSCASESQFPMLHLSSGNPLPYTKKRCDSACSQSVVSERCKCLMSDAYAVHTEEEINLPFCGSARELFEERLEAVMCAQKALQDSARDCGTKCPSVCNELVVSSSTTSSNWPRHSQKLGFYKSEIAGRSFEYKYLEYKELGNNLTSQNVHETLRKLTKLDKIERNFLKLDAIMADTVISEISTKRKVSFWDLMSSVASFLNMFSGITLIVFVEILDYGVHLFYLLSHRQKRETTKAPNGQATTDNYEFNVHL